MPIGWITEPPIVKAPDLRSGRAVLRNLKAAIANYLTDVGAAAPPSAGRDAAHQQWLERGGSAYGIVDAIKDDWHPDTEDLWVYLICAQPIGVMTIAQAGNGFLHIDYLATHPGSADCGGVLMQKAVQLSVAAGCGGKIRLCAANDHARQVYAHLGFKTIANGGADDMELDPATSAKWARLAGSYHYAPYVPGSRWAS